MPRFLAHLKFLYNFYPLNAFPAFLYFSEPFFFIPIYATSFFSSFLFTSSSKNYVNLLKVTTSCKNCLIINIIGMNCLLGRSIIKLCLKEQTSFSSSMPIWYRSERLVKAGCFTLTYSRSSPRWFRRISSGVN